MAIPPHTPLKETVAAIAKVEATLRDAADDVAFLVGVVKSMHDKVVTLNRLVHEERELRMARKAKLRPGLLLRKEAKDGKASPG